MNRQYSPGLDRIGKNILVNNANIAIGKVQTDSGLNRKSQIPKYKQTLITEILNPKQENPEQSLFWSLVFRFWILFDIWCLDIGALVMENHKSQKSNLKQNSITEISNSKHNNSDQSLFKTLEFKYE